MLHSQLAEARSSAVPSQAPEEQARLEGLLRSWEARWQEACMERDAAHAFGQDQEAAIEQLEVGDWPERKFAALAGRDHSQSP